MYVYIKCGDIVKRFADVTLKECFKPAVGDIEERRVLPALWFKVLVLDAVLVDHDNRAINWSRGTRKVHIHQIDGDLLTPTDVVDFFSNKENVLEDGECYDFDPSIDELFDTAARIVDACDCKSPPDVPVVIGQQLLRLLHVFILPVIKFRVHDRQAVLDVLARIEFAYESIESSIKQKNRTKKNTENSLRRQREKLIATGNFISSQYIAVCDEEFLRFFLDHVEKDVARTNEYLNDLDINIQSHRHSLDVASANVLQKNRSDRDSAYEFIKKCITVREAVTNIISRPHVKKNIKRTPTDINEHYHIYKWYTQMSMLLLRVNRQIQELIHNKIHIASVMESVALAESDIDKVGESYGYQRSNSTLSYELEANIHVRKNRPKSWSILTDKVSDLLTAQQFGFLARKEKFCESMNGKIQKLLHDYKVRSINSHTDVERPLNTSMSSNPDDFTEEFKQFGRVSENRCPTTRAVKARSVSQWSTGSIPREEMEAVCQEIVDHITQVSAAMAFVFKSRERTAADFLNNVYICYEYHVSSCLMQQLYQLFGLNYRDKCESLTRWLSRVSLSDLGFDDTNMAVLLSTGQDTGQYDQQLMDDINVVDIDVGVDGDVNVSGCRNEDSTSENHVSIIARNTPEHVPFSRPNDTRDQYVTLNTLVVNDVVDSTDKQVHVPQCVDDTYCIQLRYKNTETDTPLTKDGVHMTDENTDTPLTKDSVHVTDEITDTPLTNYGAHLIDEITDTLLANYGINLKDENTDTRLTIGGVHGTDENTDIPLSNDGVHLKIENKDTPLSNHSVDVPDENRDTASTDHSVHLRNLPKIPKTIYSRLSPRQIKFYQTFYKAETFIKKEASTVTLFKKYRQITKLVRYIETELRRVREEEGSDCDVSTDDIIDIFILIISRLEADTLLNLYAHIELMTQLSPDFLQHGMHGYSLTTIHCAFKHLFEQQDHCSQTDTWRHCRIDFPKPD